MNPAPAPVTWPQPADIANGAALSATQLDATSTIPGTFVYSPGLGTVLTQGPHLLSVTFTPTDTIDYKPTTVSVAITVSQGTTTYDSGTVSFVANTTTLATVIRTKLDGGDYCLGTGYSGERGIRNAGEADSGR